jgi:hypothetical protein
METRETTVTGDDIDLERGLDVLLDLLENERTALRGGDARRVAALNEEKERIATRLADLSGLRPGGGVDARLSRLARDVARLAAGNHAMLQHMHTHYCGMIDLLLRAAGRPATYERNGAMAMDRSSDSHPRTIA